MCTFGARLVIKLYRFVIEFTCAWVVYKLVQKLKTPDQMQRNKKLTSKKAMKRVLSSELYHQTERSGRRCGAGLAEPVRAHGLLRRRGHLDLRKWTVRILLERAARWE